VRGAKVPRELQQAPPVDVEAVLVAVAQDVPNRKRTPVGWLAAATRLSMFQGAGGSMRGWGGGRGHAGGPAGHSHLVASAGEAQP
jgi:hypothetical protein